MLFMVFGLNIVFKSQVCQLARLIHMSLVFLPLVNIVVYLGRPPLEQVLEARKKKVGIYFLNGCLIYQHLVIEF